jgi:hypothetical protein
MYGLQCYFFNDAIPVFSHEYISFSDIEKKKADYQELTKEINHINKTKKLLSPYQESVRAMYLAELSHLHDQLYGRSMTRSTQHYSYKKEN